MTQTRYLAGALLLLATACGRPAPAPVPAPVTPPPVREPGEARAEVLWDRWGIPHIFARDMPAAVYAFGWAQMRNHGNLLLRLYGQARGRGAEYWGERYLESDTWVWTNGIPGRAEQWLEQQQPQERSVLDAFVAGINAYGQLHPDSLAPEVRQVLPVQPADVLAHLQRVLHFTFVVSSGEIAGTAAPGWAARVQRAGDPHRRAAPRSRAAAGQPHLPWGFFTCSGRS
jgi:acyl-homoserine-lactone acylase